MLGAYWPCMVLYKNLRDIISIGVLYVRVSLSAIIAFKFEFFIDYTSLFTSVDIVSSATLLKR